MALYGLSMIMNHSDVPRPEVQARLRRPGLLLLAACALAFAACARHGSPTNGLSQATEIDHGAPGSPTKGLPQATEIDHGDPNGIAVVALTFDTSNDPGGTAQILDTLKAKGVKATFAVTGRWAELNPGLMRRVVNEGHSLINHSYHHWSFTGASHNQGLTQAVRWNELDTTEAMVQKLTGATTKPYFRPPFGDDDASVQTDVYARGYTYDIRWNVDSLGWQGLAVQAIVDRCLSLAKPGAIYLFHVGIPSQDYAALPAIIDGLRSMGYSFVTVPEMISSLGKD
jgi:peptidoglycan/xylan/chitin deacetylase (PgdA/CDA1 family)